MTNAELIKALEKFDPNLEVAILDGFNGGGEPRAINFGPHVESNKDAWIKLDYRDLESDENSPIIVIGFGCY